VKSKLEKGAIVADVGCGRGKAIIKLAQAFPNSRFVGFDKIETGLEHARTQSVYTGVSDRLSFRQMADGYIKRISTRRKIRFDYHI
jgi:tRNA G46 methylase TrmB